MSRRRALMAQGDETPVPLGLVDGTYTNSRNPDRWSISVSNNVITQTNSYNTAVEKDCYILIPLTRDIEVSNGDTFGMIQRGGHVLDGAGKGCYTRLSKADEGDILTFGSTFRPSANTKYTGTATADATAHYIKFKPQGGSVTGTATFTFEIYKGDEQLF